MCVGQGGFEIARAEARERGPARWHPAQAAQGLVGIVVQGERLHRGLKDVAGEGRIRAEHQATRMALAAGLDHRIGEQCRGVGR